MVGEEEAPLPSTSITGHHSAKMDDLRQVQTYVLRKRPRMFDTKGRTHVLSETSVSQSQAHKSPSGLRQCAEDEP